MTHEKSVWARAMGGTLATAALVAAMSGTAVAQSPGASAEPAASPMAAASIPVPATPFTIGYSNGGGVGNGFREEQVCTAKAEATALGAAVVNPLTNLIHRNTDAAGQLADLRTLISQKVNALVFNPNNPDALNPALAEAHAAGIPTVSVDSYVTDPNTWNLYNNQVKYAQLGAEWLFKQMGGKGTVWYTRGLAGNSADSDRDIGFNNALAEYPNIVVQNPGGTFTGWDPATATQITNDEISSGAYDQIQGIWASGMGTQIDQAIKDAGKTGELVEIITGARLARSPMAAPIIGDAAAAANGELDHLVVPHIGVDRPAMDEEDGLSRAPILVESPRAVRGLDVGPKGTRSRTRLRADLSATLRGDAIGSHRNRSRCDAHIHVISPFGARAAPGLGVFEGFSGHVAREIDGPSEGGRRLRPRSCVAAVEPNLARAKIAGTQRASRIIGAIGQTYGLVEEDHAA